MDSPPSRKADHPRTHRRDRRAGDSPGRIPGRGRCRHHEGSWADARRLLRSLQLAQCPAGRSARAGWPGQRRPRRQDTAARQARGASALRALVESYLSDRHLGSIESGCPVAALASEMPRQSPEVREAAAQRVRGLIAAVQRALPQDAPSRQRPRPSPASWSVRCNLRVRWATTPKARRCWRLRAGRCSRSTTASHPTEAMQRCRCRRELAQKYDDSSCHQPSSNPSPPTRP